MKGSPYELSEIQAFIIDKIAEHSRDIARVTAERFRLTRQAVNRHLRALVERGLLRSDGQTRRRVYELVTLAEFREARPVTQELQEDRLWRELVAPRLEGIPENVRSICNYGFTEMVNNVVDHSGSAGLLVSVKLTAAQITVTVSDSGVGIFRKIKDARGLDNEREAILELTKGKLTTDPERHTGEGIFFTSRMFDAFSILSGSLFLVHDAEGDWVLEDRQDTASGTHVEMAVNPRSKRSMSEVFRRYSGRADDYGFHRTHVAVKLASLEGEQLVSRSQAKRIMARLDEFTEVVLDFREVDSIGPAFADEIFRVFRAEHPRTRLVPINASDEVMRMIDRALGSRQADQEGR